MATESSVYVPNAGAKVDIDTFAAAMTSGAVMLFDRAHVPAPTDTPASFHEATFTGYSRIANPAFAPAFINADGKAEADSQILTWMFTAGAGSVYVYGLAVLDVTGTKVLLEVVFQTPQQLTPATPALSRVIQATAVREA